jgi:hypothetical protein
MVTTAPLVLSTTVRTGALFTPPLEQMLSAGKEDHQ